MSQIKIQKIEKLFNQSIKTKQRFKNKAFKSLCNMSDYIAQSILNGNDFGYVVLYERMIKTLSNEGDS